jgi:hypothetical protein
MSGVFGPSTSARRRRPGGRARRDEAPAAGDGRGEAGRPGTEGTRLGGRGREGTGRRRRDREGTRPLRPGTSKGRGRLGHGPGRLWPWPRRPGVREMCEGHRGGVRGTRGRRHRDARFLTKTGGTSRILRTSRRAVDFWSPIGDQNPGHVFVTATSLRTSRRKAHDPARFPPEASRPCAVPPPKTSRDPGVPWRPQPARAATGRPGPSPSAAPAPSPFHPRPPGARALSVPRPGHEPSPPVPRLMGRKLVYMSSFRPVNI